jgi:hypothetical protein
MSDPPVVIRTNKDNNPIITPDKGLLERYTKDLAAGKFTQEAALKRFASGKKNTVVEGPLVKKGVPVIKKDVSARKKELNAITRNTLVDLIEFFEWTEEFIKRIANIYGYMIEEYAEETNHNGDKRIYFCFHKL